MGFISVKKSHPKQEIPVLESLCSAKDLFQCQSYSHWQPRPSSTMIIIQQQVKCPVLSGISDLHWQDDWIWFHLPPHLDQIYRNSASLQKELRNKCKDGAETAKIRLNRLTSTSPAASFRKPRCLRKSCQEFIKRDSKGFWWIVLRRGHKVQQNCPSGYLTMNFFCFWFIASLRVWIFFP